MRGSCKLTKLHRVHAVVKTDTCSLCAEPHRTNVKSAMKLKATATAVAADAAAVALLSTTSEIL